MANLFKSHIFTDENETCKEIERNPIAIIRLCTLTCLSYMCEIKEDGPVANKIRENRHRLKEVPNEQISNEIILSHQLNSPSNFWRHLKHFELLSYVFPEMANAFDVDGGKYHAETVWEHLIGSLDAGCLLTKNPFLRLAIVLHDVGKPKVAKVLDDGFVHFYKHEVIGSSIVYKWMLKMKFNKEDAEYVSKMIKFHQWRFDKESKDRTIRRWLQDVGPEWEDLIILRCADRRGNFAKKDKPMVTAAMRNLIGRAEEIINSGVPVFRKDLAINSKDMEALGLSPTQIKEMFPNLLGLVLNSPEKNNKEWLTNYINKQLFGDKNGNKD